MVLNNSGSAVKSINLITEEIDKVKFANIELLRRKGLDAILSELNHSERAKFQISLAYTLSSLYYINNNASNGRIEENLLIVEEIKNIKSFVARLNGKESSSSNNSIEVGSKRINRSIEIDIPAAKRIITHQIS